VTTALPQAEGLGRIRTLAQGPDGALWLTTSNGTNDRIVRIAPTATTPSLAVGHLVSPAGVTLVRTGTTVSVFIRSTGDVVRVRRSADDGATWAPWASTSLTSTNAPSVASMVAGRENVVTRTATGSVVHTYFQGGIRRGSTDLGGRFVAQHAASLGDGTLDVFAVATNGAGFRQHWGGGRWSGWVPTGGHFTSGLSVSADPARGMMVVSGRGGDGLTWEREFTPTGATGQWTARSDGLSSWSDRALADAWPGLARLSVGVASDRRAVVQRGTLVVAMAPQWTSAGDISSRPDGSFLMVGRGGDGAVWVTDGGPRSFQTRSLGGVVR
jgi:hypothetical protein